MNKWPSLQICMLCTYVGTLFLNNEIQLVMNITPIDFNFESSGSKKDIFLRDYNFQIIDTPEKVQ